MKYLLDTCVISEATKRKPDMNVVEWLGSVPISEQYISSVTLGEIQKGIYGLDDANPLRQRLVSWLAKVRRIYSGRIMPFDEDASLAWGRMAGENARAGRTMPIADSQIAAIAIVNGMKLVTRNVSDMAGAGVSLLNPFE